MTTHDAAVAFSSLCAQDARLNYLTDKYDNDPNSLTDAEFTEMCNRMDKIHNSPFVHKMMMQAMQDDDGQW